MICNYSLIESAAPVNGWEVHSGKIASGNNIMGESLPLDRTPEWLAALQARGYRTTAPLRLVVQALATSQRVLSPLQVYELVHAQNPRISLVTVYRTVEKLEELGLIQRVHTPSGCQAFIAGNSGHQHILICENCGRVEFFGGDMLDPLISGVSQETGYRIAGHWLQLFGTCTPCQQLLKNS